MEKGIIKEEPITKFEHKKDIALIKAKALIHPKIRSLFIVLLFISFLIGCASAGSKGDIDKVSWAKDISGWYVICGDYVLFNEPMCRLSKGNLVYEMTAQMKKLRVKHVFSIESLIIGHNHHPGSIVYIRQGNDLGTGYEPYIYADIAKRFLFRGGDVQVKWIEWPSSVHTEKQNIDGFKAAYLTALTWMKKVSP